MDELTPDICKTATVGDTTQLIDWRDRKSYWVAKLKDNNCWMTQNLDYDDPGGIRITSTLGTSGGPNSEWKNDNAVRQYWDPGEKIVNGTTLAAATSSTDRHLLVGNYYSWLSATNGAGTGVSSGNVSGSICPAGWQLPTSNNTNSGSFGGLLSGLSTASDSALLAAPYYFVRGGYVNSGNLNNAGSSGYYWSSTAKDSSSAYVLNFYSSYVNPSNYWNHYLGMSVRCLVQGS